MVFLPPAYAAPIAYYYYLVNFPCEVEIYGHYLKQTYANRCYIASANGLLPLTIPVEKSVGKCFVKDIKISNHSDWQTLHWRAIESAYNSTPFFEFYADELHFLYKKRAVYLLDFNINLQNVILNSLFFQKNIPSLSNSYGKIINKNDLDLRELFSTKKNFVNLHYKLKAKYYQVFSEKFGFQENLSIFDLLFNLGNEARPYLIN
jgi:hypothetical protein